MHRNITDIIDFTYTGCEKCSEKCLLGRSVKVDQIEQVKSYVILL